VQAVAVLATGIGSLSDWLQRRQGWKPLHVRRLMQAASFCGAAVATLPLALSNSLSPNLAITALSAAVAMQAFNYSGFHSYVQEVAPRDAGVIMALTNTCGTVAGAGGNLLMGHLAGSAGGYSSVFALTVGVYLVSAAVWLVGATGQPLNLTHISAV
jgi:MFS family permease